MKCISFAEFKKVCQSKNLNYMKPTPEIIMTAFPVEDLEIWTCAGLIFTYKNGKLINVRD